MQKKMGFSLNSQKKIRIANETKRSNCVYLIFCNEPTELLAGLYNKHINNICIYNYIFISIKKYSENEAKKMDCKMRGMFRYYFFSI